MIFHCEQTGEAEFTGHIEMGGAMRRELRAATFDDFVHELRAAYLLMVLGVPPALAETPPLPPLLPPVPPVAPTPSNTAVQMGASSAMGRRPVRRGR